MATAIDRCRLCLVVPPTGDPAAWAERLAEALSGGDVASVILAAHADAAKTERAAEALVPVAQARGGAAVVHNDMHLARRTGADGVHIDGGLPALTAAVGALRPRRIVGAGGLRSRHDAMTACEAEPDYLFFGRLDGDAAESIHPKALALAAWWSSVAVVQAVVMGGRALSSVTEAAASDVAFVALSDAVWEDKRGAAAAVTEACERLATIEEPVA